MSKRKSKISNSKLEREAPQKGRRRSKTRREQLEAGANQNQRIRMK